MLNYKHNLQNKTKTRFIKSPFGQLDGQMVELFTIEFENQVRVSMTNYGCTLTSIWALDRDGELRNIIAGFDRLEDYLKDSCFTGGIIGPYANRIKAGKYEWEGKSFQLSTNQEGHHLHGGYRGLDKVVWDVSEIREGEEEVEIEFTYFFKAGAEGYPGNIQFRLLYIFTKEGIELVAKAVADEDTPINLTQHPYFNLNGVDQPSSILDHELVVSADQYFPVDTELIPFHAESIPSRSAFDFRLPISIRSAMAKKHPQINQRGGYDHCFILSDSRTIQLYAPASGIKMTIHSNQKGVQLYTPNAHPGIEGVFPALCLEPQFYPNGPNLPDGEQIISRSNSEYIYHLMYSFSVVQ